MVEAQSSVRNTSKEDALEHFSGPYADLFPKACDDDKSDRVKIVTALESLAKGVSECARQAELEQKRLDEVQLALDELEAWKKLFTNGVPAIPWSDFSSGVKPNYTPYKPPQIDASFSATTRNRTIGASVRRTIVSANPDVLDTLVKQRTTSDSALTRAFSEIRIAISRFNSSCGWADTSGIKLFPGLDEYTNENLDDRTWIEGISAAFRKAGTGTLDTLDVCQELGVNDPKHIENLFNDPSLTPAEIRKISMRFAENPAMHGILARISTVWRDNLINYWNNTPDASRSRKKVSQEVSRLTAIFQGISTSKEASAITINTMGGDRIVDTTSFAGLWTEYKKSGGQDLAYALKRVFRIGEPELAARDPKASEQLALDMAAATQKEPTKPHEGNHAYALSYLLKERPKNKNSILQPLSAPFLTTLGSNLESFERQTGKGIDHWKQKQFSQRGIVNLFSRSETKSAFDPMSAYFTALGVNPQAALQFFTGTAIDTDSIEGYELTTEQALDRQKYWINQRSWAHDGFTGILTALDGATTDPETARTPLASALTTNLVKLLANRNSDTDIDGNSRVLHMGERAFYANDKLLPGSLSPVASTHLANIFNTYMPAVDETIRLNLEDNNLNGTRSLSTTGLDHHRKMPKFSESDLFTLTKCALSEPEGFATLRQGLTQYTINRLDELKKISKSHEEIEKNIDRLVNENATTEGFFVKASGEAGKELSQKQDAYKNAWIDGGKFALQLASGILPGTVEKIADSAIETSGEELRKQIANSLEKQNLANLDLAKDTLNNSMETITLGLFKSGIINMGEIRNYAEDKGIPTSSIEKWFPAGRYPTSEDIEKYDDLKSMLLHFRQKYVDMSIYETIYEAKIR